MTSRSSSPSSTSSSSTSTSSTTRDDRTIIRTDGGTVTVQRRNGALEIVDVTIVDGWHADKMFDDAQTLLVSFTSPRAHVDVTIRLSATGITSSSSSTTG
jgi:hypothetical protein